MQVIGHSHQHRPPEFSLARASGDLHGPVLESPLSEGFLLQREQFRWGNGASRPAELLCANGKNSHSSSDIPNRTRAPLEYDRLTPAKTLISLRTFPNRDSPHSDEGSPFEEGSCLLERDSSHFTEKRSAKGHKNS